MAIDPSAVVAPTARVHPEAVIGPRCVIGEYCVIEADVKLGVACRLEPYVFIKRWTSLGDDNAISAGTCLGTDPFDKAFDGRRSYLRIGHRNTIREHYTISRGTQPESVTEIGDGNYIMSSGHVAHNCRIGNDVVLASCALVAGYVEIEDQAFVSGGVGIHQFSRIGRLAMIGGSARVNLDIPPYFMYAGTRLTAEGVNLVGLKRAGFTAPRISALKQAYHLLYDRSLSLEKALERIEHEIETEEAKHLVAFIRSSKRGICRRG
ncbi:MAG: acyl-ACP--UDP-N-acetylglucosamine O-acyltransferase [Bryobacterales bacterium]|nr:acyl-ACP--UDP-N-acetylglucosamine O-acyltransferase [Bryobacterales bacterium]